MKNYRSKSSLAGLSLKCLLLSLLLGGAVSESQAFSGPEVKWAEILNTPTVRDGLLQTPDEFFSVIPPRNVAVEGIRPFTEVLKAVYETFDNPPETHYFFCTVYYTPQESGFTTDRGFNTAHGSLKKGSKTLPHSVDFLKATYVEGYGKIAKPVGGNNYLAYTGKYAPRILGNRNNTLQPRQSIAVHRGNPLFNKSARAWILDPEIYNQFGALRFQVADTGGGLYQSQIDLYWGEDDPLGPGSDVWRPASCDVAVRWMVPVLIWKN